LFSRTRPAPPPLPPSQHYKRDILTNMGSMTREEVIEAVTTAHKAGEGVNLTGARLDGVDLAGADLTDANLTDADLKSASLPPSALTNPTITDTQWEGAIVGPTKVTDDRLKQMRAAATTTDSATLKKYSRATAIGVRMAAATNTHCPDDILLRLATDPRQEVRTTVVHNPACPSSVAAIAAFTTGDTDSCG